MEDMKWDMAGAGAVIGAMAALAGRKAKVDVVGLVGLVENMPSSAAQRPGDVVTSYSGQTVEIINTDAEGRLVLGDVLWYCQERFQPAFMVDLATLTGGIIVSLGHEYAGLFSNDDALAQNLLATGTAWGEKLWRMPLGDAYDKMLKSDIADMKNVGGRPGGSISRRLLHPALHQRRALGASGHRRHRVEHQGHAHHTQGRHRVRRAADRPAGGRALRERPAAVVIRVRIAPAHPAGPVVVPVAPGQARPGFAALPGQAALVGEAWLVTLGEDAEAAGALAGARLMETRRATLDLRALTPGQAVAFVTGVCLRAWRCDRWRGEPADRLARLDVLTAQPGKLRRLWARQEPVLAGVALARALVTEPADTLTPAGFIRRLAPLEQAGVRIEVLKRAALRRAGLGGLLAVGGGSVHPPRLVVLRWAGDGAAGAAPVVLAGKGVTFDTGGLCIKPAAGMEEMRADMAGAAACAGAMLALALRRSPAPAAAVLALAENATGGASYRPSDVLRMGDGSTVEVVDTDAEGRLVLADALAWALRELHPAAIVDLATLTGSNVVALGMVMAGLFSNDAAFAAHVAASGQAVGEPVWRMPIGAGHREDLRSAIADLRHCVPGRGQPDACHAAAFLREFVGATPWAHLDIAGLESRAEATDRHAAGATGFGVRLLDRLVERRFEAPHR